MVELMYPFLKKVPHVEECSCHHPLLATNIFSVVFDCRRVTLIEKVLAQR